MSYTNTVKDHVSLPMTIGSNEKTSSNTILGGESLDYAKCYIRRYGNSRLNRRLGLASSNQLQVANELLDPELVMNILQIPRSMNDF